MLHKCAYCQGRGKMHRSCNFAFTTTCQVCSGKGTVYMEEPVGTCAFCGGIGMQPNAYPSALLTCAACRGKGVVTVKEPSILCPDCSSRGRGVDGRLYCLTCRGKGRVEGTGRGSKEP